MEYKVTTNELIEMRRKNNALSPREYLESILEQKPLTVTLDNINSSSWFNDFFSALVLKTSEHDYKISSSKKLYYKALRQFSESIQGDSTGYYVKHK